MHYYLEYPKCDNQAAILIVRTAFYNQKLYSTRELLIFITMAFEIIAMENDNATVAGICQILDLKNTKFEEMHFDHKMMRNWLEWMLNCSPLKIREIYIINCPKDVQRYLNILRTLLPHHFSTPYTICSSMEELYKHIPQKCLPEEYGGTNGHQAECVGYLEDLFKSYRNYFAEEINYGSIRRKRIEKFKSFEGEFGASGSFRKLSTD